MILRRILLNLCFALAITWLTLCALAMSFAYLTNLAMDAQYQATINLE